MNSLDYMILLCVCVANASPISQDTSVIFTNPDNEAYTNIVCKLLAQLRSHDGKENIDYFQLLQYLLKQKDIFNGQEEPDVKCPNIKEAPLHTPYVPPKSENFAKGLISVYHTTQETQCDGSLTILLDNRSPGSFPLKSITSLKLTGKRYRNLLRNINKNKRVIKIQAEGNCCWMIFSKIRFLGQTQYIYPGFDEFPDNEIKSAKRISC